MQKMDVHRKIGVLMLLVVAVCSGLCSGDRQVSTKLLQHTRNDTGQNYTIAHIMAKGDADALHYVISTIGLPTVFIALTKVNVEMKIDWDSLTSDNATEMAGSIRLMPPTDVLYSFTALFTKLIDYNDTKDSSDMTSYGPDTTGWSVYDFSEFVFEDLALVSSPKDNIIMFKSYRLGPAHLWTNNGTFSIKLQAFGGSGREDQLPRLQYNPQLAQFDLNIDHLWTNFTKSRFAVEMVLIGGSDDDMKLDETRSIDDEFAPAVFTISNWLTKPNSRSSTGFLQWKPVCYMSLVRARNQATYVRHYDIQPLTNRTKHALESTIAYAIYGDAMDKNKMSAGNFSFGLTDDGFYYKSKVVTWSGSLGYGDPPFDEISKTVIIIICSGLGLPAVLMILGGIYVCVKKQSPDYGKPLKSLNNDYKPVDT